MSKLRRWAWSVAVGCSVALFGAGCGDSEEKKPMTPTELCNTVAQTECGRLYACTTEADRAAFGLTVSYVECVLGLAAQLQCATATPDRICAGSQPSFPTANAEKCMQEANAASCAVIKDNRLNFGAYAPSCGQCVPSF